MAVRQLLILFIPLIFSACRKVPKAYTANDNATAQTTPPDMVYVPAGGDLPSFYMGVTEESNINHVIYLEWLKRVFVDYPEVIEDAQSKSRDVSHLLQFNDPYYSYYQTHEAFAYYPVTGLTWVQAMNYLQWKGDRLNEFILMDLELSDKTDILNQIADNNFATEAYLAGQYDPVTKNELPDLAPGGTTRKVRYDDGILFATMRLPTEAEWDHALAKMPEKPIDPFNYAHPFSKQAMYPYGKNYYTFLVGREGGGDFDYFFKRGFEYHYNYDTIPATPDRLTGPADYDLSKPGIANMKGNVHEWLFDKYSDDKQYKNYRFINYFSEWCMPLAADSLIYDPDGHYLEKDSLGRMHFNIFGIPQAEYKRPLHFRRYKQVLSKIVGYNTVYVDSTKHRIEPGNYNISRKGEINFLKYYKSRCYGHENNYFVEGAMPPEEDISKIPVYFNTPVQHFVQVDTMIYLQSICYGNIYQEYVVRSLFKNDIGYYYKIPVYEYIKYDTAVSYRLIKGGNWKQPDGNYRQKMREDEASPNVGFRAVITYPVLPILDKKYRVRWK